MKKYFILSAITLICSCNEESSDPASASAVTPLSCKGVYYTRDASGNLNKFNQYWLASASACLTDNVPLSQLEKTSEAWTKNDVKCVPQPQFYSRSLISDNNYYSYRDGKVYLDFNSSTGVYRRIILAEDKTGNPVFSKLQGCYFQRTGAGVDLSFGKQLLLDTDVNKIVTSENFDPYEIFKYDETATTLSMTRFDSSDDWSWMFCPYISTPWGYCDRLRDGNIMYWPNPTTAEQNALLNEALLIRKQYNYTTISSSVFEDLWKNIDKTRAELGRDDYKYKVIITVDTPRYIDQAWYSYLVGERPTMPDVNSNLLPPICYDGFQNVTLSNGNTGRVRGQICYINGEYTFTQF